MNTTSKVLERAQPSMQMESDYEMARQAIPGALKTVEGFWIVDPDNKRLIKILTEGYCQYGTAFVEDDWEEADFKKDLAAREYHNTRASHIFTRCLNYALKSLGSRWQKDLFASPEVAAKLIKDTGPGQRTPMMFAGLALGSIVNHNLTRVEMLAYLPVVEQIMNRVIELDQKNPPSNLQHRALPYIALGMVNSARPKAMGGDPDKARQYFEMALKITAAKDGTDRFLLARTLMAYRVGKATNDQKFFHEQLKQVLMTAPSVWPEQRLANEVAHRKARRYLSHEKELF
ncbi:MAG TPA: TRAP transporter TatT component family protein [Kofleriaceae bacterium]|nr:TRAP transporter TatT component family protein [Kofleriaceae bacterium]